jgi:hypothetical protein
MEQSTDNIINITAKTAEEAARWIIDEIISQSICSKANFIKKMSAMLATMISECPLAIEQLAFWFLHENESDADADYAKDN